MTKKEYSEEDGIVGPVGEPGPLGPPGADNSYGPKYYKRDENGLLQTVQYQFNEDGSINWRAMIKEEHLFPNKSHFEMYKKPVPKTIKGLRDNQLLIKLSGIKELAKLRGFSSVDYKTVKCEHDHVAVVCSINFLPNYETHGEAVCFEDMANATLNNTSSFATKFLETIACNRAFVRCVRNFLNIHIVGDDEIDKSDNQTLIKTAQKNQGNALTPNSVLENLLKNDKNISSFEEFKEELRSLWSSNTYRNDEAKSWEAFSDIPPKEARILIKIFKN